MSYVIDYNNKKLGFVHIPKNAGNSIITAFPNKSILVPNNRSNNKNYHSTIFDIKDFVNTDNLETFTVVRNPWSRAVSWFLFRKKILLLSLKRFHTDQPVYKVIPNYNKILTEYNLMTEDFNLWLENYIETEWDYTWFSLAHKQSDWLDNSVTKIFKFETLQKDFKDYFDITLPHKNKSATSSLDWRSFYSTRGKEIIKLYHNSDISLFDYRFK